MLHDETTSFKHALERVSDGIIIIERDWTVTFINQAGMQLTGTTWEQIVGRHLWDTFPEAPGTESDIQYSKALETQQPVVFDTYYGPLQGWFSCRAFPSEEGLTIYFQNVNELRALQAERARFESLVKASRDFIAIADFDGNLVFVNPAGREMVGLDPAADVSDVQMSTLLSPDKIAQGREVGIPALRDSGHYERRSTLRHLKTGADIPVDSSSFVIHDMDTAEPIAFATIQRDISELLDANEKLRQIAEERHDLLIRLVVAQEAERARIAADVHDDSVQALAAVDLRLGLLKRKINDAAPHLVEQVTQLQATVAAATDRLRELLFDLEPAHPDLGLITCLRDAAAHVFEPSTIEWSFVGDLDANLPDVELGEAVRIAKEALINARNHSNATHVTLELHNVDGGVQIAITDDGVGMSSPAGSRKPGHRGLLNMQERAEISGGWMRLESAPGQGTTVRYWLPTGH